MGALGECSVLLENLKGSFSRRALSHQTPTQRFVHLQYNLDHTIDRLSFALRLSDKLQFVRAVRHIQLPRGLSGS